jgi:excisionase family DNA binding protein
MKPDMSRSASFDGLIDAFADRVATRIQQLVLANGHSRNSHRLLSVKEAAEYLGRSVNSVRHLITKSDIRIVKADRRVQIHVDDLDRWIEANKI